MWRRAGSLWRWRGRARPCNGPHFTAPFTLNNTTKLYGLAYLAFAVSCACAIAVYTSIGWETCAGVGAIVALDLIGSFVCAGVAHVDQVSRLYGRSHTPQCVLLPQVFLSLWTLCG